MRDHLGVLQELAHPHVERRARQLARVLQALADFELEPAVDAAIQELQREVIDHQDRRDRERAEDRDRACLEPRTRDVPAIVAHELESLTASSANSVSRPEILTSRIHGSHRSNTPSFARRTPADRAQPATARRRCAEHGRAVFADHGCSVHVYQSLSRCHSLTQNISTAQRERHGAIIDLGAYARLVAAIGGQQRLVEHRQAAHLGQELERRIDRAQRLLLAAVVVAQDVARAHGVVLQVVALRQLGDARVRQQLAHPLDVQVELERQRHPFRQAAPDGVADRQIEARVQVIDAVLEFEIGGADLEASLESFGAAQGGASTAPARAARPAKPHAPRVEPECRERVHCLVKAA